MTQNKPSHQITSKTSKKSKTTSSPKYEISQHAPRASGTHNYMSIRPLKESTSKSNLTNSAQEEIPKPTKHPNHVMPSPMPTTGQTELRQYPSTPTPTAPAFHHTTTQLKPSKHHSYPKCTDSPTMENTLTETSQHSSKNNTTNNYSTPYLYVLTLDGSHVTLPNSKPTHKTTHHIP